MECVGHVFVCWMICVALIVYYVLCWFVSICALIIFGSFGACMIVAFGFGGLVVGCVCWFARV